MSGDPKSVKFHYIKSPLARDIHANGFFGGIHPITGAMHMSVFAERPPIPTAITFEVKPDGNLASDGKPEGREGMVRVVQDTLYMDLATAVALKDWLSKHIDTFFEKNPDVTIRDEQ